MPAFCIICKKYSIPGGIVRSFHIFPKNAEFRKKWMDALGLKSIAKTATICSDHFHSSSFRDTDGYTYKRRLNYDAIPSRQIVQNIINNEVNNSEKQIISHESIMETKENSMETSTNLNAKSQSLKRVYLSDNTENVTEIKKFCLKMKHQPTALIKEDFKSEEAWRKFVAIIKYKNDQLRCEKNKKQRREKKIQKLKNVADLLKSQKEIMVAKYAEVFNKSIKFPLLIIIIDNSFPLKKEWDPHVEMFFSLIRQMNSFCNNPTTLKCKSVHKKLLHNIHVPASANNTPQDTILLTKNDSDQFSDDALNEHKTTFSEIKHKKFRRYPMPNSKIFRLTDFLHKKYHVLEHNYSKYNYSIKS